MKSKLYDPTLWNTMREFANTTSEKYGGHSYATGYFMSMLERIALEHPEVGEKVLNQLNEHLMELK